MKTKITSKKILSAIVIIAIVLLIFFSNLIKKDKSDDQNFKILTSFYPMYVITLNIVEGANGVEIANMADHTTGCIHDYTLNTADLKKFENADVFVQSGKGLESFTEKITELYPNVNVINSGEDITNLIQEEDEINAHIWLSIDNYILQVKKVAEKLAELNPDNESVYSTNCEQYVDKLSDLKSEYENIIYEKDNYVSENNNYAYVEDSYVHENDDYANDKKAICLNEALEYLLKDLKIDVTSIETDHEQSVLSAQNLKNIINKMKDENIKVIFIDKEDDAKTAEILSEETGAKIYRLDSAMSGNGSKEDYINIMKKNLEIIKNVDF